MHSSVDVFELFVFTYYYHPEVTLRGLTAYALLLIHGNQKQTGGGRAGREKVGVLRPVNRYGYIGAIQTDGEGVGGGGGEREREAFNAQSTMKVIYIYIYIRANRQTYKERKLMITKNENSVLKQIYANSSYNTLQELSHKLLFPSSSLIAFCCSA